jgi:hypothetical protein
MWYIGLFKIYIDLSLNKAHKYLHALQQELFKKFSSLYGV